MFKWLRRFANDRSPPARAHNIAAKDYAAAAHSNEDPVKWLRKMAEQGGSWGQFNLGVRYVHGQGVPQDFIEAVKWFQQAAAQGEALAQYSLGQMYDQGQGVLADKVEAYKWLHLAASHGITEAEVARDLLRRSLSAEQLAEGQRRAAAFVPRKSTPPLAKRSKP